MDKLTREYRTAQLKKTDDNNNLYKRNIVISGTIEKTFHLSIDEKEYQKIKKILCRAWKLVFTCYTLNNGTETIKERF